MSSSARYTGPNRRRDADTEALRQRRARLQAQWDAAHEVTPAQERRTKGESDRRRPSDRRILDRRSQRIDAARRELQQLRQQVQRNAAIIERLEGKQNIQLVRIAQLQREVDGLKKK